MERQLGLTVHRSAQVDHLVEDGIARRRTEEVAHLAHPDLTP
jgi:hypothetical protein